MDTNEDDEHDDGERDGGEDRDDDDNGNMKATKAVTKVDLTNEMGADGLSEVVPSSRSLPPSLKVAPNVAQAIPMMKEQSNKSKGKGKGKSTGTERVSRNQNQNDHKNEKRRTELAEKAEETNASAVF